MHDFFKAEITRNVAFTSLEIGTCTTSLSLSTFVFSCTSCILLSPFSRRAGLYRLKNILIDSLLESSFVSACQAHVAIIIQVWMRAHYLVQEKTKVHNDRLVVRAQIENYIYIGLSQITRFCHFYSAIKAMHLIGNSTGILNMNSKKLNSKKI